ncbi:hypothetical protein E4U41_003740, partial [Claviceps citrina]
WLFIYAFVTLAGAQQYKDVEILFVLKAILRGLSLRWIITMFERRFGRRLTENQVRYIKNKYGRDPRFGTPMANAQNFGISSSSNEWPESDGVLEIDFDQFERQGTHLPQPNLRVSNFPRLAARHSPSASAASQPPRPPRNCPGPLRRNDDGTQGPAVAGQKRAHDGEDDDVDELTGSLEPSVDQIHHYLGLSLSVDSFGYGATSWGEVTTAARADGEEGSPLLDGATNAEAYLFDWGNDDTERQETESDLQQQHHYQFRPEDAQILWMDHCDWPLGLDIPGWEDALPASDLPVAEHEYLDVIDWDPSNILCQQLAATVSTSNQQALQLPSQETLFQIPGVPCREDGTDQVIQTSDNNIVKPVPDHHNSSLGPRGYTEPQEMEQSGPLYNEPFQLVEYSPLSALVWPTDMASANEAIMGFDSNHCAHDTPWMHASLDLSALGKDEPSSWTDVEARRPASFSPPVVEEQEAAGSWDGESSYEGFHYFDGS